MRSGSSRSFATRPSATESWASRRPTASTCPATVRMPRTQLGGRDFHFCSEYCGSGLPTVRLGRFEVEGALQRYDGT
eukprot:2966733-Pyramimonas_sp.AAC.1